MMERLSENYYRKIITENLYLHFFNREIYRGLYGDRIEKMRLNHSDILTTIMLCGYNPLLGAYSAYRETVHMLTDEGRLYRELQNYGVIRVTGEALNQDMILAHKQEMYYHNKEKYPGYFDAKEIRRLEPVVPVILKPDVTDRIEALFLEENWKEILRYAPSSRDADVIDTNRNTVLDIVRNRDNRAITKSIFKVDSIPHLAESTGRTLTAIYVDDYRNFAKGDIVTGIPGLAEYDKLSKHFPSHDYEVLRELLSCIGFPRTFTKNEFERLLKHYHSDEHFQFALKLQELLYLLYNMRGGSGLKLPIAEERVGFLPVIRAHLCGLSFEKVDFEAHNFFSQCIENVEYAISTILKNSGGKRKEQEKSMENKKVFVVTGRNEKLRISIFSLLRALKLEPMEWMDVISSTGRPDAYIHEAIKKSMDDAGAVVVIMAPEEEAKLLKKFHSEAKDEETYLQSRPNVIFEAGLALGLKEEKTIILQFGESRIFSDILGKHILKYKGKKQEIDFKTALFQKLRIAGCSCDVGSDYFTIDIDYD